MIRLVRTFNCDVLELKEFFSNKTIIIIIVNQLHKTIHNGISSIYKFGLSVCLSVMVSVCLFVSNKRQNGWTDRGPNFLWDREGLWKIKISNICLHQNSIVIKFFKILKIHEIFCENPRIIFVLFYDVHKENLFTINLEDGREAPSKASVRNLFMNISKQFHLIRV